jgi:CBS domain-containing protein
VINARSERVAKLKDLVARLEVLNAATGEVSFERFPPVSGLVVDIGQREIFVPWSLVESLDPEASRLSSSHLFLESFERREGEVLLYRDILDKQLIDIDGRRVIRANDLQLYQADGMLRVAAVDVSAEAILRRLTWGHLFTGSAQAYSPPSSEERHSRRKRVAPAQLIAWADVDPLASDVPDVRLRLSHERLALLNPVDIAHIIDELSYSQGAEIIESLDDETAADTLQEIDEERQADIVETMDQERAADILEEMDPDDAADLLQDLEETQKEDLLRRMDREEAEDVEELLMYHEDTAGGIMTSDFVAVPAHLTVDQTIAFLRGLQDAPDVIEYLYVVEEKQQGLDWAENADDNAGRLIGIVSLRDLLLAPGSTCLEEIMDTDLVWVGPHDSEEQAAHIMAEYNLIALPVLDEHEYMLGIITVDDAMEVLIPERWSRRIPHVFS